MLLAILVTVAVLFSVTVLAIETTDRRMDRAVWRHVQADAQLLFDHREARATNYANRAAAYEAAGWTIDARNARRTAEQAASWCTVEDVPGYLYAARRLAEIG